MLKKIFSSPRHRERIEEKTGQPRLNWRSWAVGSAISGFLEFAWAVCEIADVEIGWNWLPMERQQCQRRGRCLVGLWQWQWDVSCQCYCYLSVGGRFRCVPHQNLVKILKMATSMLAGAKRPVFSSILLYVRNSANAQMKWRVMS